MAFISEKILRGAAAPLNPQHAGGINPPWPPHAPGTLWVPRRENKYPPNYLLQTQLIGKNPSWLYSLKPNFCKDAHLKKLNYLFIETPPTPDQKQYHICTGTIGKSFLGNMEYCKYIAEGYMVYILK